MESLRATSFRALRTVLADQPTTLDKVSCAFRVAVGPAMGRAVTLRWDSHGTLRVSAKDATWRREIKRAKPVIESRLAELLGEAVVKKISIVE
jgi:hypothetical protein